MCVCVYENDRMIAYRSTTALKTTFIFFKTFDNFNVDMISICAMKQLFNLHRGLYQAVLFAISCLSPRD